MTESDDLSPAFSVERYTVYEASDGTTTVCLEKHPDAWLRSDTTVELRR